MSEKEQSVFKASWILPISSPPIKNGIIIIEENRIVAVCSLGDFDGNTSEITVLENTIIMPSFINAHTHLELGYLKGKVEGGKGLVPWVEKMIPLRKEADEEVLFHSILSGIEECRKTGVGIVGDISNSLLSPFVMTEEHFAGVVFNEVLGTSSWKAGSICREAVRNLLSGYSGSPSVGMSIAPHAPYSCSGRLLKKMLSFTGSRGIKSTVHLAEDIAEYELFEKKSGPWKDFFERKGEYGFVKKMPGVSSIKYLNNNNLLYDGLLAVHLTEATDEELDILKSRDVKVCICPRSNMYISGKLPPVREMINRKLDISVGTDSLASNSDLNIAEEIKFVAEYFPDITCKKILQWVTVNPARALGIDSYAGTLETWKCPGIIAIELPELSDNPEEDIVKGSTSAHISFLAQPDFRED